MDEKAAPEKAARKIRHKTRRQFLEQCAAAAVGAAAATMSACKTMLGPREEKRRLNVLFLMTDQHRHNALGFRGDPYALTPNLDRLAASGTVFTHNYCQNPVCVPARVSILTGRYTHSTGTLTNDYGSDRTLPSFPQVLRANGYKTACFGKLHVSGRTDLDWDEYNTRKNWPIFEPKPGLPFLGSTLKTGQPLGAPSPLPEEAHREWRAKEETIDFMRRHRNEPWLIQCSFAKPHPPFQPIQKYWDVIDRSKLIIPSYPEDDLDDTSPNHWNRMIRRKLDKVSKDDILDAMQGYYGNLAFCDALFGEVLKALDDLGLRENTLIVFTSDHGEMLYAHHLWTKKTFFDESVRTPLFLSCPSAALAGKQSDALVEHIDLFPTIMDVLDIKTPSTVQGRSLLPLLRGVTEAHRPYVRSERAEAMIMQFDGRFKYIDNGPGEITELYDDVNDPREITNLANRPEYRERIAKVIQELRAWAKQDVRKAPIAEKNRRGGDQS